MKNQVALLLARASLHHGVTLAIFVVLFGLGFLVRRSRKRVGTIMMASPVVAGLALVAFCAHAVSTPGAPRTAIMVADKTAQVADGRMVSAARWGLVDRSHVEVIDAHIAQAVKYLREPPRRRGPLVLEAEGGTLTGDWTVRREYRLREPATLSEASIEDAARAIALQLAFDVERNQERAPAWTGLKMSAWQFEDLPSALFACVAVREVGPEIGVRFSREGWELVEHDTRAFTLPADALSSERTAFERLRRAHALWTGRDGELEDPFASATPIMAGAP